MIWGLINPENWIICGGWWCWCYGTKNVYIFSCAHLIFPWECSHINIFRRRIYVHLYETGVHNTLVILLHREKRETLWWSFRMVSDGFYLLFLWFWYLREHQKWRIKPSNYTLYSNKQPQFSQILPALSFMT